MSDQEWLGAALAEAGGCSGTVHRLRDGVLRMTAAVAIPEPVQRVVAEIPHGKGMAGLAWERDQPVETCDLKTDETGDVRPGAKAVDAHAAVAIPVHDGGGGVRAVVGFAFHHEDPLDTRGLMALAERLPLECGENLT